MRDGQSSNATDTSRKSVALNGNPATKNLAVALNGKLTKQEPRHSVALNGNPVVIQHDSSSEASEAHTSGNNAAKTQEVASSFEAGGSHKKLLTLLDFLRACYPDEGIHAKSAQNCDRDADEALVSIFNFPCKFRAGGAVVFHPSKKELNNNGGLNFRFARHRPEYRIFELGGWWLLEATPQLASDTRSEKVDFEVR